MKKLLFLLLIFPLFVYSQDKYKTETKNENGYTYETVSNDPLNARVYTLPNGLKVYMTVYKDAPRIQTYIAVRAGSKNDPAYATGLAHYLEHILFKGTSRIGSSNWEKEKIELRKIELLYERYRRVKDSVAKIEYGDKKYIYDEVKYKIKGKDVKKNEIVGYYRPIARVKYETRADIYRQIDSISLVAATYAIANEYDKLLGNIGATGTNAYTYVEQTVYVNDIPSNQIDKWAEIEAERFSMVVPRLFHTELEAVYEEKNKGMDQDRRKVWEELMAGLFQKHQYGTQTTIGTVEHLKNPSITEIKKYFDAHYVPNNMAICISGDFDPAETIKIIDKYWGKLKPKEVPSYNPPVENPIAAPIVKNVLGPDAENITMGFRLNGINSNGNSKNDADYLKLIAMLLSNGQAGLIDLNLLQQQKVLTAYAYDLPFKDYSSFVLGGRPLEGQTLEQVKDLLLVQLDSVKQGRFGEWLIKAVINDYKIYKMREFESNRARADAFVDAFIWRQSWEDYISEIEKLESISKEDIVKFARENFKDNYVVVYKRIGVDTTIQKVPKPKISPVSVNREMQSDFYKQVMSKPSDSIAPVFVDYTKDIQKFTMKNKIPVNYIQNKENEIFQLSYVWDAGKDTDPRLALAVSYIDFLGTDDMSAEDIKKEFYKLGCSYTFSITNDQTFFSLTGLQENFVPALKLFEKLITDAKEDKQVWAEMVERIIKSRKDNKLSKDIILKQAMVSYAKYGSANPFTNILPDSQLKALDPKDLAKIIKYSGYFKHRILYYGPADQATLNTTLYKYHKVGGTLRDFPPQRKFEFKDINENIVYYVNYNMVQAEVMFLSKSVSYDKNLASTVYLFNEYFGGNMGSLVFQEMRESKALAYAVKSSYDQAGRKEDPNYINSYIGTQADKIHEAIQGLQILMEDMPESEALFLNAKTSGIEMISSQRITKASILYDYERSKKLGLDYDLRRDIYKNIKTMSFSDIKAFQQKYMKGQKKIILVIGSKDKIDFKSLEKYGKVKELTLEEIFGY
ncbi:MAG: insulinase family protein [Cytophagaceae bacterium]|nr:insulinase family protein [Cytophagaceae bacterium]